MEVLVATHGSAFDHDTGERHPERPERVAAVHRGVVASGLDVVEVEAPRIERSELGLAHDASYIEMIEAFCSLGGGALDMDTVASEATWDAALRAAGAVRVLTEELRERTADCTGFAITRPPGHHAFRDRAMGFCFFNNVAVTTSILRSRGERVAILDWDVHHGNGTQSILGDDPGTLYVSIHQGQFYPYEGQFLDIDSGEAKGTNVNIPLPAGTGGDIYRSAWAELVTPVVSQFAPDWILVSAGYDAHVDDPLADMNLVADDYGWMAAQVAAIHPPNRTVLALEGGYDLGALEQSSASTLQGLAGANFDRESATSVSSEPPPASALAALDAAAAAIARHWTL
jgi:acetoin utilization deacetylase AcuC-like enzyme